MSIGPPEKALSPTFGFTGKLNKKSTLMMASSGLENAATERTSAQSKALLANTLSKPTNINSATLNSATLKSATLNKEGLTLNRNMSDFSGPATSEARDRRSGSMRDSLDSSLSAGAVKKIQEINRQKKKE